MSSSVNTFLACPDFCAFDPRTASANEGAASELGEALCVCGFGLEFELEFCAEATNVPTAQENRTRQQNDSVHEDNFSMT